MLRIHCWVIGIATVVFGLGAGHFNPLVAEGSLDSHKQDEGKYQITSEIKEMNAEEYFNLGNALADSARYDEAIEKFKKALEINPKYVDAYINWGMALCNKAETAVVTTGTTWEEQEKRYRKAIELFQKAAEIDPGSAKAYSNWGVALNKLGRYEEAIEKFKKAVEINPKYNGVYLNWGWALENLGRKEEGIEIYQRAVEINPKDDEAYSNWGVALGGLGRYEEAIEKFKKVVEINPKYTYAYDKWGYALDFLGREDEAVEVWRKKEEIDHKSEKLITAYKEGMKIDPKDPKVADLCLYTGYYLLQLGRYEEAAKIFKKAVKTVEDLPEFRNQPSPSPVFYAGWGKALFKLGRYEEACRKFNKANELFPSSAPYPPFFANMNTSWAKALLNLGKIDQAKEKITTAKEMYEKQGRKAAAERVENLLKEIETK